MTTVASLSLTGDAFAKWRHGYLDGGSLAPRTPDAGGDSMLLIAVCLLLLLVFILTISLISLLIRLAGSTKGKQTKE